MTALLRVMTWNVRSLRDDTEALVEVVQACRPHVLCLQEAPRFARWRSRRAALARRCGLLVAAGQRDAGVGLLVALSVDVKQVADRLLSPQRGLHQRGIAAAALQIAGRRVVVASTHLGLDPDQRLRHAAEARQWLDALELPLVLAADVNEPPGDPAWARLSAGLQDAAAVMGSERPTFPALAPDRRLDVVLSALPVRSCAVPALPGLAAASDHLPLLAEIELPG